MFTFISSYIHIRFLPTRPFFKLFVKMLFGSQTQLDSQAGRYRCTQRQSNIKDRQNNINIRHNNIDILERFQGSFISDCWLGLHAGGVVEGSEGSGRLHYGSFTTTPNMIDLTCHFSLLVLPQNSHKLSAGSGKLILSLSVP